MYSRVMRPIEQLEELQSIYSRVGRHASTVAANIDYLFKKFGTCVNDINRHYKYVRVHPGLLSQMRTGKKESVNSVLLAIYVDYFNTRYSAGLGVGDFFVDLEARDNLKNF